MCLFHVLLLISAYADSGIIATDSAAIATATTIAITSLDALEGMLFFSAFGDSLGSYTESTGLAQVIPSRRSCVLPLANSFYNTSQLEQNCWKIWPPFSSIATYAPVTDDTMYKISLFEPWLLSLSDRESDSTNDNSNKMKQQENENIQTIESIITYEAEKAREVGTEVGGVFDESSLKEFLAVTAKKLFSENLTWPQDYESLMRRNMMANFVVMMNAAGVQPLIDMPYGNNTFWRPESPVEFGLYLFLPAAGALAAEARARGVTLDPFDVFNYFRQITGLDESYGAYVTGIWAALIVDLFASSPSNLSEAYFQRLDTWLPEWQLRGFNLTLITAYHKLAYEKGQQLRNSGQQESDVVSAFLEILQNSSLTPTHSMRMFDPLVDLGLLSISLGFARGDVVQVMRLISASTADTDTVGAFYGQLAGSAYGRMFLEKLSCDPQVSLQNEFQSLQDYLGHFFAYSFDRGLQTYFLAGPAIWRGFIGKL